jgi:acetylornithine/N-succinyldiaminopimelate aminotransferase
VWHAVYLIIDEVQTGFFRAGPAFMSSNPSIKVDFLTMAKGIAGGFPFGAFAFTEEIAVKLEKGDHGGTYCGNPLGCSVASAVIGYMMDHDIGSKVEQAGSYILTKLNEWRSEYPEAIADVRGKGLLIGMEFKDASVAQQVKQGCFDRGLLINVTQGNVIRIFPALNITPDEAEEGMAILKNTLDNVCGTEKR